MISGNGADMFSKVFAGSVRLAGTFLFGVVMSTLPGTPPAEASPQGWALPAAGRLSAPDPPVVDARSWVVADLDSGDVLAAENPHLRASPASTQKMLTALTLLPRLDPEGSYRARKADTMVEGTAAGLTAGRIYSHDDLFHALFLPSANDAANALARANGGIDDTVRQMNEVARELGARDTVAANPSGLEPDFGEPQY